MCITGGRVFCGVKKTDWSCCERNVMSRDAQAKCRPLCVASTLSASYLYFRDYSGCISQLSMHQRLFPRFGMQLRVSSWDTGIGHQVRTPWTARSTPGAQERRYRGALMPSIRAAHSSQCICGLVHRERALCSNNTRHCSALIPGARRRTCAEEHALVTNDRTCV
jgi:hypothetical protein